MLLHVVLEDVGRTMGEVTLAKLTKARDNALATAALV